MSSVTTVFALPDRLARKADPALIEDDERFFAALAAAVQSLTHDLQQRLDHARKAPGGAGQAALDRDQEIHRLSARLRALHRYDLDVCLGHLVLDEDSAPRHIGRLGLTDASGRRLLIDWRSPAAEPFFAATQANRHGARSRRRYRWTRGRITDYWDEAFTLDAVDAHRASLDDQSAFIADLATARTDRMRDVLGTIASDQDTVIRAGSRGALVVDGGPGTGKTVVALHRAAYLLYADPRLGPGRGGVLVVGPHRPYLTYVADVLPSLGEEGVLTCTLADLVPHGSDVGDEPDPAVARLKSSGDLVRAVEAAVRLYEEPPTEALLVETPSTDVWVEPADWAEAFDAAEPGTPHNDARDQVWEELLRILVDHCDGLDSPTLVRSSLEQNRGLRTTFHRAWPLVDADDLVGDLWSVPAYLHRCAPWLSRQDLRLLQREDPQAWTTSDLPFLDAARRRLGDPDASRLRRRQAARLDEGRARVATVIEELIQADEDREGLVTMLVHDDLQAALVDDDAPPVATHDRLAGPFAHIVVDEAQELTDGQWQMLLSRCPSGSFTIVGDRAQARHGFTESWQERLTRAGLSRVTQFELTVNYRTPEEVMAEAEPVIRAVIPDANVPTSIRHSGIRVTHRSRDDRDEILRRWLAANEAGVCCVIGDPAVPDSTRIRSLPPELCKGLEFDLVLLVDPERFGPGVQGAVDRYVAMTRTTRELVVLTS